MQRKTKIWLIIAAFLVVVGVMLFAAVMSAYNWDFTKLSTNEYENNVYEVGREFSDISIRTDTADISFAPAEDGNCRVACYEQENVRHAVTVQNGILTIYESSERKWYDYIGISVGVPKVTVYLPDAEYGVLTIAESTGDIEIPEMFRFGSIDILTSTGNVRNYAHTSENIRIETSTGDIHIENISADTLDLSVSTGRITVSKVNCAGDVKINVSTGKADITDATCKNYISSGTTGDIFLQNVMVTETISIDRSTGDVKFDGCDAAGIFIKTDTGDVMGTFLSEKVFLVKTDTGSIDVPKSIIGGSCEVTTGTGDIELDIQ